MAIACGGGGEEKTLLNKYFMASKVRDNMTLSNIATVVFDPKTDGQMMSFNIVSVSAEKVTPLTLKADAEALKAAMDDEKAFTEKKKVYQDANADAIDRIIKAEGKNQPLKGKDAEIQKEWNKWREETAVHAKTTSELRQKVSKDQPIIEISCQDQREPDRHDGVRRRDGVEGHHHRRPGEDRRRHLGEEVRLHAPARHAEERQRQGRRRAVGDHGPQGRAVSKQVRRQKTVDRSVGSTRGARSQQAPRFCASGF